MGFLLSFKMGFQTAFAQTYKRNPQGITKPVHWGCKGVKVLIVLFKVTQGYGICDGHFSKGL
jgi:hypothetical protein